MEPAGDDNTIVLLADCTPPSDTVTRRVYVVTAFRDAVPSSGSTGESRGKPGEALLDDLGGNCAMLICCGATSVLIRFRCRFLMLRILFPSIGRCWRASVIAFRTALLSAKEEAREGAAARTGKSLGLVLSRTSPKEGGK